MTNVARKCALRAVTAGIIGGAALGLAGMANAQTSATQPQGPGYSYSPGTHAKPAPEVAPGGHHGPQRAYALLNR